MLSLELTQRVGTREERLTWRGANKWSCCKQAVASAWTNGSWWSCITAQAHKKDDRAMQIDVVLPANTDKRFSLIYILCSIVCKPVKRNNNLVIVYQYMYSISLHYFWETTLHKTCESVWPHTGKVVRNSEFWVGITLGDQSHTFFFCKVRKRLIVGLN